MHSNLRSGGRGVTIAPAELYVFSRTRPVVCLWILLAAIPATLSARPDRVPQLHVAATVPLATDATVPVFRLGTAGRPFGWSTAVGDFNADGQPDVIVADVASPWTRNSGYRLGFAISGEMPASDSFQAPDGGIGIRVADVDHDSDLDIVLASTISGRTIGVWLNDGNGRFTRAAMELAPLALLTPDALDGSQSGDAALTLDLPSRRGVVMSSGQARAPTPAATSSRPALDPFAFASRLSVSSASPRAPPALL